jgi:hypothetical protein
LSLISNYSKVDASGAVISKQVLAVILEHFEVLRRAGVDRLAAVASYLLCF